MKFDRQKMIEAHRNLMKECQPVIDWAERQQPCNVPEILQKNPKHKLMLFKTCKLAAQYVWLNFIGLDVTVEELIDKARSTD